MRCDKITLMPHQIRRARHHLKILNEPGATIGVGTDVGAWLLQEGMVAIVKFGRYGITPKGVDFLLGRMIESAPRKDGQTDLFSVGTRGNPKALLAPEK